MKKPNLFLTTVAMVGILAMTGCGASAQTETAPQAQVQNAAMQTPSGTIENVVVDTPSAGAANVIESPAPVQETEYVAPADPEPETYADTYADTVIEETPEYADWATSLDQSKEWQFILQGDEELAFTFNLTTDETDYKTYGTLLCVGNKETKWEYTTGKYELGQNYNLEVITNTDRVIYVNDGGTIVALDAKDGHVIWKNSDYQGAGSTATIDDNGNLYVAGYECPSLIVVDPSGNTVIYVEQFADYYWTRDMYIEDDMLHIYYEGVEGAGVIMDITDYSYTIM